MLSRPLRATDASIITGHVCKTIVYIKRRPVHSEPERQFEPPMQFIIRQTKEETPELTISQAYAQSSSQGVLHLDSEGLQILIISGIGVNRLPNNLSSLVAELFAPLCILVLNSRCFLYLHQRLIGIDHER